MKKLGLIGGIGPESTIAYYRLIIKRFKEITGTNHFPEFLIYNIDLTEMLELIDQENWDELVVFLKARINNLGPVDYVAMASNTPHVVFEQLAQTVDVPLISIVKETINTLSLNNIKRAGLLGTKATMTTGFYQQQAMALGVEIIIPSKNQQDYVHEKYMSELVSNEIDPKTKIEFISIVNQMDMQYDLDCLVLGGTELPLILNETDFSQIQIYDTTKIHVEAIVRKMIAVPTESHH